ncbi:MAG: GNAT family N-acetyltransferase [Proteobacteria bacterium]|nr:GNAT family N-acetyltransferase [Pseudomonadota bacterium]
MPGVVGGAGQIRLVAPEPRHAEAWMSWRNDPTTLRFMAGKVQSLERLVARLQAVKTDLADRGGRLYRWMAVVKDVPIGTVSLSDPDWTHGHAEIGYLVAPELRGRGVGSRMVSLAIERAFAGGLYRLIAIIHEENGASERLVERLGFRREGLMRQHNICAGERADHVLYGLLKPEFRPTGTRRIDS